MTKLEIDKPKFGELTQIASDLYWVHFELPFSFNGYSKGFINSRCWFEV